MLKKAKEFCNSMLQGKQNSHQEKPRPLLILALDEAHALTDSDGPDSRSKFTEFRSALFHLSTFPFFTLLLSTAGKFHLPSPQMDLDPSARILKKQKLTLPPIPETGFDQLAFRYSEGVSLREVTTDNFMAHLGRPLFVHHFPSLSAF